MNIKNTKYKRKITCIHKRYFREILRFTFSYVFEYTILYSVAKEKKTRFFVNKKRSWGILLLHYEHVLCLSFSVAVETAEKVQCQSRGCLKKGKHRILFTDTNSFLAVIMTIIYLLSGPDYCMGLLGLGPRALDKTV